MRTLHLFAGAGGGLLADLILGHMPVGAVEIDPYACVVLRERAVEGWFPGLRVHEGDIRDLDFSPWAGCVDQIAAGFSCQDISSAAGLGAGIAGVHSGLVWEVFRAIDAVRPGLVFLENSPRIRTKGRRDIIAALVARGYAWRDGTLAAADVGAGHERDRWWLPTLTVCGNWNRRGASAKSGDGLATALRMLPTLLASDGQHGGPNCVNLRGNPKLPALYRTVKTLPSSLHENALCADALGQRHDSPDPRLPPP